MEGLAAVGIKPKGPQAQWRFVYDRMVKMNVGDLLSNEEVDKIAEEAGAAPGTRGSLLARAVQEMESKHSRTLANVRGVGYRMVAASEHSKLAAAKRKRARRQLRGAVSKLTSADRSQLTETQRRELDLQAEQLRRHDEMLKRLDAKTKRHEDRLDAIEARTAVTEKEQARTADAVDEIQAALRRFFPELEKRLDEVRVVGDGTEPTAE